VVCEVFQDNCLTKKLIQHPLMVSKLKNCSVYCNHEFMFTLDWTLLLSYVLQMLSNLAKNVINL